MQSDKTDDPSFHCTLPEMQRLFASARWRWPQSDPISIPHPADVFEYTVMPQRR